MERRRNAVYIIIVLSLLAGLATGRSFFFNVAYAFIGLLVFSFMWAWQSINWFTFKRNARTRRVQFGSTLEERFSIQNTGLLPKLWLEIYDYSDLPGHQASTVLSSLRGRSKRLWHTRTLCLRRGTFSLGPMRIITGDPFGLFQPEREIEDITQVIVYPAVAELSDFHLPLGITPGGDALKQRTHYITANATGIRDYVVGDSFSRIHWRSTARQGHLIVKEFELDPLSDVWILMDADRTTHSRHPDEEAWMAQPTGERHLLPPATEDYAVTICASLANYFLKTNRSVGFSAHSQRYEIIQADRGPRHLEKILEALAMTEPHGTLPFDHMMTNLGGQFARGTTVILVTASTRPGWIASAHGLLQRGLQVVAVLIDAESFGGRPGSMEIVAQLNTLNIPVRVIRRGDDLQLALNPSPVKL